MNIVPAPQARVAPTLWLLRGVWALVFGAVLLVYTVGLPDRLGLLVLVLPFRSYWAYLDVGEAALLAQAGLAPQAYFWALLSLELLLGYTCIIVGGLIFWRRSDSPGAILCALMILALGGSESSFTGTLSRASEYWFWVRQLLQAVGIGVTLLVFYTFPDGRFTPRWTRPLAAVYTLIVLIWAFFSGAPFNPMPFGSFGRTPIISELNLFGWYATGVVALTIRYRRYADTIQRQQMKWAFFGLMLGFVVALSHYGLATLDATFHLFSGPLGAFLFGFLRHALYWVGYTIVAVSFGFALLRYRLWDVDQVIRRTLVYAALSLSLAAITLGAITLFQQALRLLSAQQSDAAIVVATLLGVLLFWPLRARLQVLIERRFDRTRVDFRAAFTAFARELRTIIALPDLLGFLLDRSTALLRIAHGAVYLRDANGVFGLAQASGLPAGAPERLPDDLAAQLQPDTALDRPSDPLFPLLLPLLALRAGRNELLGVLALGPRRSEQPYTQDDRTLLLSLADQAGTAIAVAQLVAAERELAAYRASPAGRAETLATELALQPAAALDQLHTLAERALAEAGAAQELEALPVALRRAGSINLADLAEGYRYLAAEPGDGALVDVGLRLIGAALERLDAPLRRDLFVLLLAAREAATPAAISGLAPDLERLLAAPQLVAQLGAPIAQALVALRPVPHTLGALLGLGAQAEQLACLERAAELAFEAERLLPADVDDLSRRLVLQTVGHWRALIGAAITQLRGRAEIELRLISGHVIAAPQVLVGVELRNRGLGPAVGVRVALRPDPSFVAMAGPPPLDLAPGARVVIHFELAPAVVVDTLHLELRLGYDEAGGAPQTLSFPVALITAPAWSEPLPNPYLAGRPLRPNSPVFVGRDEDVAFIAQALARPEPTALVLTGQRRMGKTSLLRQLGTRLGPGYQAVYLDGQILGLDGDTARFYHDLALRIARELGMPEPSPALCAAQPGAQFLDAWLPLALAASGARRLLLLLDEIEAVEDRIARGRLDGGIFELLRHLMQHEPRLAIICAGAHRLDTLLPSLGAGIFNAAIHRRIGSIDGESARRLLDVPLAERLRYDDLARDALLRLSGGQPYFLQLLGQVVVDQANAERRTVVLLNHAQAAIEQALDLGAAPLDDLWSDSGPAERLTLLALAHLTPPGALVRVADLSSALTTQGLPADHDALEAGLQQLAWRDILRRHEAPAPLGVGYRWRLALLGRWVARTQPLALGTRAVAVGLPG